MTHRFRLKSKMNDKLFIWLILALIVFIGVCLSINRLGEKSLWQDEITTVQIASKSIPQIYRSLERTHMAPPLHYLVLHLFLEIGSSEFIVRFPSIIFFILSIIGCFLVAKVLFGKKVALMAALLFALSPLQLQYAQEARMYSMCQFFFLMSLYFFIKALESHKPKFWIAYIVMTGLSAYAHYFVLFYLFIQGFYLIGITRQQLVSRKGKIDRLKTAFKPWLWFATGILCVFLLYLPRISSSLARSQGGGFEKSFSQILEPSLRFFGGAQKNVLPYIFLLFFVWGLISSWLAGKKKEGILLAIWVLLPLPIIYLFLTIVESFFAVRYILLSNAPYLIVISFGLIYLIRKADLLFKPSLLIKKVIPAVLILVIFLMHIAPIQAMYKRPKQPWRELAQFLYENVRANESIVLSPKWISALLGYYGFESERFPLVKLNKFEDYMRKKKDVWIISLKSFILSTDRALEPYIDNVKGNRIIGRTYYAAGINVLFLRLNENQPRDMIPVLKNAINIIPDDWFVYYQYGEALKNSGRIKEAIQVFEKGQNLHPKKAIFLIRLTNLYNENREWVSATRILKRAIDLNPGYVTNYLFLAHVYVQMRQYDNAIKQLDKTGKIFPSLLEKASYYLRLGDVYLYKNEKDRAIEFYKKALALDKHNKKAKDKLARLLLVL